MFDVALTDGPHVLDAFAVTQCDRILPVGGGTAPTAANGSLSCQGTDPARSFFARLFVDPASGNTTASSYDTFRACMTPRCTVMTSTTAGDSEVVF
jgi:hypothetical protein